MSAQNRVTELTPEVRSVLAEDGAQSLPEHKCGRCSTPFGISTIRCPNDQRPIIDPLKAAQDRFRADHGMGPHEPNRATGWELRFEYDSVTSDYGMEN